mgnify:CR=1 FL=1
MNKSIRVILALATALIAALAVTVASAQDTGDVVRTFYYIAADANGVQQIFQHNIGGDEQARQVTFAGEDIITYGAAYDGLSIAYVSGGQLWLQPIHSDDAEALAPLSAEQFFSGPIYSQDGDYIAYADNGIHLVELATRETRLILADVPLNSDGTNMGEMRLYTPDQFVRGADGREDKLIVKVGIWEWQTAGILDLSSGALSVLEPQIHTRALAIYGGKVLLYGNGGIAGEMSLELVEGYENLNDYTKVVSFADITFDSLFAEQAIEIHPGTVRIFGTALVTPMERSYAFFFDADLMNGTVSNYTLLPLTEDTTINVTAGEMSPDGAIVPLYVNAMYTDSGTIYGQVILIDLAGGGVLNIQFPETVSVLRWQP